MADSLDEAKRFSQQFPDAVPTEVVLAVISKDRAGTPFDLVLYQLPGVPYCGNTSLWGSDGAITHIIATGNDITEHRQAEEASREERNFTSSIVETVGAMVVVLDSEGRIVRFNRACERASGYLLEEVNGRHVWDFLLIPEEIEPVKTAFENLKAAHFPNEHENYWVAKNGARRLIAWSNTALQNDDGNVTRVIATGIDITERERAEESLRSHQQLLKAIYDTEPECVKLLNADGTLTMMNRAGLWMVEADLLDEIQGECICGMVAPEDRDAFQSLTESVFHGESGRLEFHIVGRKGTRRTLENHAVPLRKPSGEIISALAITRDITERKHAEENLRESERALRAGSDELRALAARLISAQEEERATLARELHDDFNQRLAMMSIEAARQIEAAQSQMRFIFVTVHADPAMVQEAFRIGASGYVLKRFATAELVAAVRNVLQGKVYVSKVLKEGIGAILDKELGSRGPAGPR